MTRLVGVWHWFKLRLSRERCIICDRLMPLHPPMRWTGCYDTPLPIQITEQSLCALGLEPRIVVLSEQSDIICPWHGRFLSPDSGCGSCAFLAEAVTRTPLARAV